MNIQKQVGGNDCGLFAIAILTCIANSVDVTNIQFDQKQMRSHLIECVAAKKLTLFPHQYLKTVPSSPIIKSLYLTFLFGLCCLICG